MANQIRITPDQMRQRANEYRREAETVHGVISKMDTLLTQLQAEWEGAASESYATRYGELKPGFIKAQALIEEIAKYKWDGDNITESNFEVLATNDGMFGWKKER